MELEKQIEKTENIKELFGLVRDVVKSTLDQERAGIDIGFVEMGNEPNSFLGAYHPVQSNIIVLNKTPLRRIGETNPELMKPYVFMVLLHEYIHSLGYYDEASTRRIAYDICKNMLGEEHPSTQLCMDMKKFFQYLIYPEGFRPTDQKMDVIETEDSDYIG